MSAQYSVVSLWAKDRLGVANTPGNVCLRSRVGQAQAGWTGQLLGKQERKPT